MKKMVVVLFLVLAWVAVAAEQMGTVSGSGLTLRGNAVPGAAESLPLTSGDEVVTSTGPAVISLADKSAITAEANTQLWIERQAKRTMICVSRGALRFSAAPGAGITICALGRPVELEPGSEGTVTIEAPDRVHAVASKGAVRVVEGGTCGCAAMPAAAKKGWSTPKKVAVVVGVAGGAAAGTAIGLAVSGAPAPVSPSKP
jgi:hypothetical protein